MLNQGHAEYIDIEVQRRFWLLDAHHLWGKFERIEYLISARLTHESNLL
jgi:hypothetical protein